MKTGRIYALIIAMGLSCSVLAQAQAMSKADFKLAQQAVSDKYTQAKTQCKTLAGNEQDICEVDAKAAEKTGMADLQASYQPTERNQYKARVAKAEADFSMAKERCSNKAGNVKDVCIQEAKTLEVGALADAKAQLQTVDAKSEAQERTTAAQKEAADDKTTAAYVLAREKCDASAGAAKDKCMSDAKAHYGKQ